MKSEITRITNNYKAIIKAPLFWVVPVILTTVFMVALLLRCILPVFALDSSYKVKSRDGGILGTDSSIQEWSFDDALKYTLSDSDTTRISGGQVEMISNDQLDSDNNVDGFGGGIHSDTQWDVVNSWVELTGAGQTAGLGAFESRVIDPGSVVGWDGISWIPSRPYYKELPGSGQSESGYPGGNAVMTANSLLLHMNESTGAIMDYSGNSNNCANGGASYGITGKLNTGLEFDGSSTYLNCGSDSSLDFSTTVTVEAWVMPDPGAFGYIFAKDHYTVYAVFVQDTLFRTYMSSGTSSTSYTFPTTSWTHVASVYDQTAGQLKHYINGVPVQTFSVSSVISNSGLEAVVGMRCGATGDCSSGAYHFDGKIDEMAVYNRPLSDGEIADHYNRGALRLKYQVRSCDDGACDTEQFAGPDGLTTSYYSELSNTTNGLPDIPMTNVANNRYFQYKMYLETDESSDTPAVGSIEIGPDHYDAGRPYVVNNSGIMFAKLVSFSEESGSGGSGSVEYQISNDGSKWYFYNGSSWQESSTSSNSNTAGEVNSNIGSFVNDIGTGHFYFKAFLVSNGAQQVLLDKVTVGYSTSADDDDDNNDDNDDENGNGQTVVVYQIGSTIAGDDDDDSSGLDGDLPATDLAAVDVYTAIVHPTAGRIIFEGICPEGSWVVAKLGDTSVGSVFSEIRQWKMELFDFDSLLKEGVNVLSINVYDESKDLIVSTEVEIILDRIPRFAGYSAVIALLNMLVFCIGTLDMVSIGSLVWLFLRRGSERRMLDAVA